MFGFASFGSVPFGGIPLSGGIISVSVEELVSVLDTSSSLATYLNSHTEGSSIGDTSTSTGEFTMEVLEFIFTEDTYNGLMDYYNSLQEQSIIGDVNSGSATQVFSFTIRGNSYVEAVGTTRFIDLIESGRAKLSTAAEIRVRSL